MNVMIFFFFLNKLLKKKQYKQILNLIWQNICQIYKKHLFHKQCDGWRNLVDCLEPEQSKRKRKKMHILIGQIGC